MLLAWKAERPNLGGPGLRAQAVVVSTLPYSILHRLEHVWACSRSHTSGRSVSASEIADVGLTP